MKQILRLKMANGNVKEFEFENTPDEIEEEVIEYLLKNDN